MCFGFRPFLFGISFGFRVSDLGFRLPRKGRRSTTVEESLQIAFFLQNKANVKIGKMNISVVRIGHYDNERRTIDNERPSKQTQFKAKQTQFLKESKMSLTSILTKDYQNHPLGRLWENKPNFKGKKCAKLHNHKNRNRYSADFKRASSLNTRLAGRFRTSELSSDKDVRICSRIESIRSVSLAIMVNQMLKSSLRR